MKKKSCAHCLMWPALIESYQAACRRWKTISRMLVIGLLVCYLVIWTVTAAAMGGRQTGQGLYNYDNGNYGEISVQFEYEFVSTQMKIRITSLVIGYSNKLIQNEPALHQELLRQHVYEGAQWLSSLRIKFTSQVSLGAGELLHEFPSISGYATSSGSDYSFFEPSEKVKQYASAYFQKNNKNFYTERATLWGRFQITGVELYKLENKIKAVRREMKSKKENQERQFASFISQATAEANQYNFPRAETDLKEAAELVNGHTKRKSQVREVEQLIEQKKAEKQKLAQQAALEEKQKKEAAEQKAAAQQQEQEKAAEQQAAKQQAAGSSQGTTGRNDGPSGTSAQSSASAAQRRTTGSSGVSSAAAKRAEEQRRKMEESQRRMAEMKAAIARQQRDAARLSAVQKQVNAAYNSNSSDPMHYINASKPLVQEFARQGNIGGAYVAGGVGLGLGILKAAQANKARNEAARRESEAKQRQWEQEERERKRREAERERLRQRAFKLLIGQRHTLVEAVSENDPVPLSTTPVEGDTIYYFIYAIDPSTFDTKQTKVYVSNVFAIARYNDGTWPYQSSIENETESLTPFEEVMHGYYLNADEANSMRTAFVDGFHSNEGVSVVDIAYRAVTQTPADAGVPLSGKSTGGPSERGSMGIPIGTTPQKPGSSLSKQKEKATKPKSLGIPLGPAPKAQSSPPSKQKATKSTTLGIPIKM